MTDRLRNNVIAGLIVFAFWCIQFSAMAADPIVSETTQIITSNGTNETTVKSPPPSAIASQITSSSSDFLCTVSASGAIQTQILGISLGGMHTDDLCELLQKSHALYNMGMKVAAISVLCNDPVIFEAMMNSTPCPIDGLIGDEAKAAWAIHSEKIPTIEEEHALTAEERRDNMLKLMSGMAAAFLFF
tara:strand:- start:1181 stop:1744 length:564 start_codon:yes stop_codon:yes gene_type:complete